jgi:hypothetical protein
VFETLPVDDINTYYRRLKEVFNTTACEMVLEHRKVEEKNGPATKSINSSRKLVTNQPTLWSRR